MYNLTFNNDKVFKIYDSTENISEGTLTIRFSLDDYTLDDVKTFFEKANKDVLNEIIKTTNEEKYVATFKNYTAIKTKAALVTYDIVVESTKEVTSLNEEGEEVTVEVPTTETKQIELITVILGYEDPTKVLVEKLDNQINPTINTETCTIDELKLYVQKKNSDALELFLENNPLLYTDEKYYGVSMVDRNEMTQQFLAYQLKKTISPETADTIKWHSKGSKCTEMTVTDFATLALAIYDYTEPYYEQMQTIKENIMKAEDKDAVLAIKIFGQE